MTVVELDRGTERRSWYQTSIANHVYSAIRKITLVEAIVPLLVEWPGTINITLETRHWLAHWFLIFAHQIIQGLFVVDLQLVRTHLMSSQWRSYWSDCVFDAAQRIENFFSNCVVHSMGSETSILDRGRHFLRWCLVNLNKIGPSDLIRLLSNALDHIRASS